MISGCRASEPSATSPSDGGASSTVPAIQSLGLGSLPAGAPGTVQPSNVSPSSSNDVVPSPVETATSSTKAPDALHDVVARVADRHLDGAAGERRQVDGPLLVAVAGPGRRPPLAGGAARSACHRRPVSGSARGTDAGPTRTGRRSRCPGWCARSESASVVQSSCPTVCASTKTKSQFGSVSLVIQNDSSAPPAGTAIVRASRL